MPRTAFQAGMMTGIDDALKAGWRALPQGRSLPYDSWRRRHRAIVVLLCLHVVAVFVFGLAMRFPLIHCLEEAAPVAATAALASAGFIGRRGRTVVASLGLMIASAILVHLSGGAIELHFHFFVMVIVISLYQDWLPFLSALGFVVLHHGAMGVLDPTSVYNHSSAIEHPWLWAGVHGGFVLAASAGCIINWRLNESAHAQSDLLLDSAAEGICGIDPAGVTTFVNEAAARLLGWEAAQMAGRPLHEVLHGSAHDGGGHAIEDCRLHRAALSATRKPTDDEFRRRDGSTVPVEYTTTPIIKRGLRAGAVLTFRDTTERNEYEDRLAYQALYDELTGLPNRRLLGEQLASALSRATAREETIAVLFLDLDRFKVVNDSLGHVAGDALLVETARRLDSSVRPGDVLGRLGGDEFAVVLHGIHGSEDAFEVATRILRALERPMRVEGREVAVSASIGMTLSGPGSGYGRAEDALRDGDIAMYQAKAAGGGQIALFDAEMTIVAVERLELENDLRVAVRHGELRLEYQPEVDLPDGAIVGVEALVRWDHPRMGYLQPARFIPIADESNLILEIGRWVLEEACAQLRRWSDDTGNQELVMAVNLSLRQLRQPDLVEQVAAVLRKNGIAPERLRLEITESVMMQDPMSTISTLHELKALGVQLAIDDFGTGYSSLSHLQRFPVSTLKVDRSFVIAMESDHATRSIVEAVTAMAQALQLEVTAEGIETETHLANVNAVHCHRGQGFLFSKPVPADALTAEIAKAKRGEPLRPAA